MTTELAPCPHCGTANFASSANCYQCSKPLPSFSSQQNPMPAVFYHAQETTPAVSQRSHGTAFILSSFLGNLGVDRIYMGQIGLGLLKGLSFFGSIVAMAVAGFTHGQAPLLSILGMFGLTANLAWAEIDRLRLGMGNMTDADGLELARNTEVVGTPQKEQSLAFALSYFLGIFGAPRFYLGHIKQGLLRLFLLFGPSLILANMIGRGSQPWHVILAYALGGLSWGAAGIWTLVDHMRIGLGQVKDAKGNSLILSGKPQPVLVAPQSPTLPFHGYGYTTTPPAPAHDPVVASPGTHSP